LDDLQNVRRTQ